MTTIALSLSLSLRAPVVPSIDFQDVGHSSDRPPANKPNQEQDVPNCRATFAYRFVAKLDHPSNRAADYLSVLDERQPFKQSPPLFPSY